MAKLQERISLLAQRVGTECKTIKAEIGTLANLSTTDKANLVAALNEVNSALSSLTSTVGTNTSSISTINTKIAELESALDALEGVVASSTNIDDANVSEATTYSSSKITSEITAAKQAVKDDLLNGAGEAFDTLGELATLIEENQDAIAALEALAAGHVKYTEAQTITDEQKSIARSNIGAASQSAVEAAQAKAEQGVTDAATAQATANQAQSEVDALETEVAGVKTTAQQGVTDAAAAKSAADAAQADVDALETAIGDTDTDFVALFEESLNASE